MAHMILAEATASVSELKRNPMATVATGDGAPVAILNRNSPVFYCVPAKAYEALLERLEDLELNATADARAGQKLIKVKLDNEVRDAQLIVVVVVAIGKRNQNEVYKAADQRKID